MRNCDKLEMSCDGGTKIGGMKSANGYSSCDEVGWRARVERVETMKRH